MKRFLHSFAAAARRAEDALSVLVLAALSLVPVIEISARTFFHTGLLGSTDYVQNLVLWITFAGGMFASREKRHLSVTAGLSIVPAAGRVWVETAVSFISVAVASCLAWAAFSFVKVGIDPSQMAGAVRAQWAAFIMPAGFSVMALRFVAHAPKGILHKTIAACGAGAVALVLIVGAPITAKFVLPLAIVLVLSFPFGTPIFVALGGLAQLYLLGQGGELAAAPNEAYTMLTGPIMPTIPLFSLAGYLLSESKAGERLVRLFRALFGWMPGGLTLMAILVSAFFTTFTGASGVTVIALGGLLSFILVKSGYKKGFSEGFVTACGSLGLLFPPSLAVILYGVVSHVNIRHLFVAGLLPGFFVVAVMAILGAINSRKNKVPRAAFDAREAAVALKESAWEVLLPAFILVGFFKGFFTLVETGAMSVLYVVFIEVFVTRDIKIRNLPSAVLSCVPIVGGVLVILASAKGLSYCVIDAEIPLKLSAWAQTAIHSKYVFLLLLNAALLVVGCFMDIFSAIIVVVPLIAPLGVAFGIEPVHLGIIFLTNLEIGYLMPPVGINLQLASFRFGESLPSMYRRIFPFVLALFAAVLAITYLPFLSTWLVHVIYG
jgi:C4-dicarboxylate transporter, DctM subunit